MYTADNREHTGVRDATADIVVNIWVAVVEEITP